VYEPGGLGTAAPPPKSGIAVIFRANAKIFAQKPAASNEKKIYLFNKKRNSFHPGRLNARNPGFFTNSSFSGAVEIFFQAKMVQPPSKKWPLCLCQFMNIKYWDVVAVCIMCLFQIPWS